MSRNFIPYARQNIAQDDIDGAISVLKSAWLTQGPVISDFETACAQYCKVKYATAVNSATSALHLACLVLGLKANDILWTSPISFVASSNCGLYCGAQVDFVDIDPQTYNICPKVLALKLAKAKEQDKLPKILVVVHFAGQSCEMKEIKELADRYQVKIIEDASHAIGARYQDEPIGNCRYSDICVFSFHAVKIITTGEGGLVTTNQLELYESLNMLRTHGITRDPNKLIRKNEGEWYYEQQSLGLNYRITDIQAAIGLTQLQKIDYFVTERNRQANNYVELLKDLPIKVQKVDSNCYSSWHLYIVELEIDKIQKNRKQVFEEMRKHNIGVNVHYIPIYMQPYYQKLGMTFEKCPNAEHYYQRTITLPLFVGLKDSEQEYVSSVLSKILLNES